MQNKDRRRSRVMDGKPGNVPEVLVMVGLDCTALRANVSAVSGERASKATASEAFAAVRAGTSTHAAARGERLRDGVGTRH